MSGGHCDDCGTVGPTISLKVGRGPAGPRLCRKCFNARTDRVDKLLAREIEGRRIQRAVEAARRKDAN
mgnify:CR=1 FL=1